MNPRNLKSNLWSEKADNIKGKTEQASNTPREILLQQIQNSNIVSRIPLTTSCNRWASNACQIMKKYWSILKINKKLAKTSEGDPKLISNEQETWEIKSVETLLLTTVGEKFTLKAFFSSQNI